MQVLLTTTDGIFRSIVPSGASKGDYEAVELRDRDQAQYHGNSVLQAVHNVEKIIGPAIVDKLLTPTFGLREIDRLMIDLDSTPDKSRLGANAILGVSMAIARAEAAALSVPLYEFVAKASGQPTDDFVLPVPFMNVLNGGDHSGNPMAFQEFMIAPTLAKTFQEAVQWNAETYASLKALVAEKYGKSAIGLGDEGGFAPPIETPTQALDLLVEAIKRAGHEGRIQIGIDPASQSFFKDGKYDLGFKTDNSQSTSAEKLGDLYRRLLEKYPIILLEDPFGQDDWKAFSDFMSTANESQVELVGDDLLATNRDRIAQAVEKKACSSLLLKINQIGTISEAIDA